MLLVVALVPQAAAQPVAGTWTGLWVREGSSLPVRFDFNRSGAAWTGTFGSDDLRAAGIPLRDVTVRGDSLRFSLVGDRSTTTFAARIRGDSIAGEFRDGEVRGTFALRRAAVMARLRERAVRFSNGDVTLAGTLILPDVRRRVPAVVFLHGSGAEGRWGSRYLATQLAERGIAALIYDKRGVGEPVFEAEFQ